MSIAARCKGRYFGRGAATKAPFPETGVAPVIIHLNGIFYEKKTIYGPPQIYIAYMCLYTIGSHSTTTCFKATPTGVSTFQDVSSRLLWLYIGRCPTQVQTYVVFGQQFGLRASCVGSLKQPWYASKKMKGFLDALDGGCHTTNLSHENRSRLKQCSHSEKM